MQDLKEAKVQYSQLVQRLISNGTTAAMIFGSLHLEPTTLLADILHQVGELCRLKSCACAPRLKRGFWMRAAGTMLTKY